MARVSSASLQGLHTLRGRLTAWYLATLCAILLFLGGGLFLVIRQQLSRRLDASLVAATRELVRAAHIREMESAQARGPVMDAIDELRIPERTLYLVDTAGHPVKPYVAPPWVRQAARQAGASGTADLQRELSDEHTLRIHAQGFTLANGDPMVAVSVANDIELEDEYAALIAVFSAAAIAAVLLVGVGGSLLVRQATLPIERSVTHMRRFMADAAHELRTPITVLRSRAEVALQQPRSSEEYASALRSMATESQRMGGIVENLLLLSRADTGEIPLKPERFFLDDVALDAATAARVLAQRKDIELSVAQFDEARIDADPSLIRQLVMILLDNAVKFTPAGGKVTMRIAATPAGAVLEVRDTGDGIDQEHLPHVFERFFRGDTSRARSDGAGLGLSIARWIADAHHATIAVTSTPGIGTRVVVTFPPATDGVEPSRSAL